MSLFFNYKIDAFPNNPIHLNAILHSQQNIVAVASCSDEKGGIVTLCNDEGEVIKGAAATIQATAQAVTLAWHPSEKILAVGWENGAISLWNEDWSQVASPHKVPVCILSWSSQGTRLVTGDSSGTVVAWRADKKGSLQLIFQTDLKEIITCFAFKDHEDPGIDISGLAKAAVAGDELALEMFSSWRPKTASTRLLTSVLAEKVEFFVGCISGAIFHFNDDGRVTEVCNEHSQIKTILYNTSKNQLVVLTDNLSLSHFIVQPDGQLTENKRLKLNGRSQAAVMVWCGPKSIAVSTRELSVRYLDLETNDTFLLSLDNSSEREHFICLDYNPSRAMLCGGTNLGRVAVWRKSSIPSDSEPESAWKLQIPNKLTGGAIQHIFWGAAGSLLVVQTAKEIFLLREQQILAQYCAKMSVVQVAPNQVSVWDNEGAMELCCDTLIKGMALDDQHIVVWGTKRITVYDNIERHFKVVGSFACECVGAVIYDHNLYCIEGPKIQVRTIQGTIKQSLNFSADEGEPIGIELCGHFLTVSSLLGWLKIFDLSRREAKLHASPKYLNGVILDFGEIIMARSNCDGSKVSVTIAKSNLLPDCKLYLWATDSDTLASFDFAGQDAKLADSFIVNHMWDDDEPKLLVCEAKLLPKFKGSSKKTTLTSAQTPDLEKNDTIMVTMYAAADGRLLIQSCEDMQDPYCRMIGVCAPHYIFLKKPPEHEGEGFGLTGKVLMPDFDGLGDCDKTTKDAVINFSYYLTVGNMDEAFKSIRKIMIPTVWESMAKMCVKTKRLDVALVCLSNMKHARGAIEVKKAMSREPELDAQVGMLALQLGLNDEAEKLYKQCSRFDLLNKFYQNTEQWDKAIKVAETQDRIHLRTTYYNYAKHLEFIGDLNAAVAMFEKSENHRFEVPRMLIEDQNLDFYMTNNTDSEMLKWWAQYLESNGDMEKALEYYGKSGDILSLVRVHCFCEKFEEAIKIASDSEDRASCYHLARQLENSNHISDAIEFFCKAHAFGNAIRLCKEQGMEEKIWSLALKAGSQDQLQAAQYFEQGGKAEKAIRLYHKAGMLHKAVDLAFQSQHYNALQSIVVDLDSNSDPTLLMKCAKFFVDNKQFEKAVEILAIAKQYHSAIELCVQNNVPVTEELADRLTMSKGDDEKARAQILLAVAESAHTQGNYHLAAKKFTQAGDKLRAMKSLLKSGDTEKIIYYCNVSRQKEIYVMAANYLQSLDWRNSPDIMKNIIAFYSKGRALDLLAEFYIACAQVEIDEFRDYEKALGAYVEASRCLARGIASSRASEGVTVENQKLRGQELAKRLDLIKKYVEIKRLFERDSDTAVNLSRELLQRQDVEATVRRGDIFALMISHHLRAKSVVSATQVLEEMKSFNINPTYYLDAEVLKALGIPVHNQGEISTQLSTETEPDIEEQVQEN